MKKVGNQIDLIWLCANLGYKKNKIVKYLPINIGVTEERGNWNRQGKWTSFKRTVYKRTVLN